VKAVKGNNIVPLISIAVGILVLMHHLIYSSRLFDVIDALYHEFFAGVFIAFGMGAFLFGARSK